LDEPTAALDPMAEFEMYEQFDKISRSAATIFISHRLASAKLADEIFVLDNGAIAERGSHDALMARNGLYAHMFESQRGWYV
jgi:ABC-type multidrug transport system fused ATPase/permease subunit